MKKYQLNHEKLDVYQLELELISWVTPLIEDVKSTDCAKAREICCHLDRASLSILFNTAEGNGRRQMKQQARFFDDARGSGTECAACLDALCRECGKNKLSQIVLRFMLDFAVPIKQNHRNSIPISRMLRLRRDKM